MAEIDPEDLDLDQDGGLTDFAGPVSGLDGTIKAFRLTQARIIVALWYCW